MGSSLAAAAPGDAPEVTGPVVSDITTTSATFEGTVNPNGLPTGADFECKRATDLEWEGCGGFDVGDGLDPVPIVEPDRDGLDPATEYQVRIVATNDTGTTTSAEVSFETLPELPPVAGTPTAVDITNDAARFTASLDPNGSTTGYHFEYRKLSEVDWVSLPDGDVDVGNSGDPVDVDEVVTGLDASTEYVVRLVATNDHGSDTSGEHIFNTLAPAPPQVSVPSLTDLSATGVRFTGEVDPNGEDGASYHFEYRVQGTTTWTSVPDPEDSFSGTDSAPVAIAVSGLTPSTDYEVRLVATGIGGTSTSGVREFVTHAATAPPRPARAYEQVSPPDKQDSDLTAGTGTAVAAASGDRFVFRFTLGAFAGSESTNGVYLVTRGPTRWTTKAIASSSCCEAFHAFNPDLSRSVLSAMDPPTLATGQTPGVEDFFARDNTADTYELLTTQPATATVGAPPDFSWASRDLSHVTFGTLGTRTYVPGAPTHAVYRLSNGDVSVASVMPGSSTPFPQAGPGAGMSGGGDYHAISNDGSRLFFTAPNTLGGAVVPTNDAQLYVRKDHGTPAAETVHISAPESGVIDPNGTQAAFFRGASADGAKVIFTSCEKLTADATADPNGTDGQNQCRADQGALNDLYVFDVDANGGAGDLIDVTTADPTGGAVQGVVGISEDGSRVYFVAMGDLGGAARRGEPNLYLWEEGEGVAHIATLAASDTTVWVDPISALKESRVTPDGRHLAFASRAQLTGVDNAGRRQVYLYHSDRPGHLECASCKPDGSSPTADSTISNQAQDQPFFTPTNGSAALVRRNLIDDGSRVFFETAEPLVSEDSNNRIDVYEYDVDAREVGLVSSGRSPSRSHFADSSVDGDDVFFWTRERLVGWDRDDVTDVYDARVAGGLPEPPPPVADCGQNCQENPSGRPTLDDPGSSSFDGPGDAPLGPRASFAPRRLSASQRRRLAQSRRIALRVKVNRSGRVAVTMRATIAGKRTVVAKGAKRAARAGTVRVPIRLSKLALRELKRSGRLRVSVFVRFAGALGAWQASTTLRRSQSSTASARGR